jgi:transposase
VAHWRELCGQAGEEPPDSGGGRNPDVDFHGERRSNASYRSTTDPEARLARKGRGKEAKLCYAGHLLTENRHGLIVAAELTQASGTAEREAGPRLLARQRCRRGGRLSVGADKGYDTAGFVAGVRALGATAHVARKRRFSALDGRTSRHAGYAVSLRRRKVIEEGFGWMKDIGGLRKVRHRGEAKVAAMFTFTCAAYNLVRLRTLLAEPSLA